MQIFFSISIHEISPSTAEEESHAYSMRRRWFNVKGNPSAIFHLLSGDTLCTQHTVNSTRNLKITIPESTSCIVEYSSFQCSKKSL